MEEFRKTVEAYRQRISGLKDVEQSIADGKRQLQELRSSMPELELAVAQAEFDRKKAENPGFFQRLLGSQADRLEKAQSACRTAAAERDRAKRAAEALERRIETEERTRQDIIAGKAAYISYLQEQTETVPEARELLLRQYALEAIDISLDMTALLQCARPGMRHDVLSDRVRRGDGRMAILAEVDSDAAVFCGYVEKLPEGIVELGVSLRTPSAYINAVTMESAQLDRLNHVMDHVWNARQKLRAYVGIG